MISNKINNFPAPFTLILGGNDIKSQIGLITKYLSSANTFIAGGSIANTFLAAQGFDIGKSPYHPDKIDQVTEIMESIDSLGKKLILPVDAVVCDKIDDKSEILDLPLEDIEGDLKIMDIGIKTIDLIKNAIKNSGTVYWNGPLGYHDIPRFQKGTESIADYLKEHGGIKILSDDKTITALLK